MVAGDNRPRDSSAARGEGEKTKEKDSIVAGPVMGRRLRQRLSSIPTLTAARIMCSPVSSPAWPTSTKLKQNREKMMA